MNDKEIIAALLPFANHAYNCDSLMPMWHKGPCDCGFAELVVKLRAQGINIIDGSISEGQPQPPLKGEGSSQEVDHTDGPDGVMANWRRK